MNRAARRAARALGFFAALSPRPGCAPPGPRAPLTYFNGEHALTVRYPASWKTDQAEQDGFWYRYFLGPTSGPEKKPEVSVTLLAGPLGVPVEQYAQAYLAGNKLVTSRDEERQGAKGRSYAFTSADGGMRYSLLLLVEGENASTASTRRARPRASSAIWAPVLEMEPSLTLERTALYPVLRDKDFAFALRLPPSWRETRRFAGGGTLLLQYTSPPVAADREGRPSMPP